MGLVNLKTDLSKFKRDSFTSDIENKSKGAGSGLNLNFASMRSIEDKFKEGVPLPNLSFGGSLDKPTPTVPTSMIGTLPKITQPPRGFHPDEDKPVAITGLSFKNLGKTTQAVPSNWEVFMGIAKRTTLFNKIDLETEEEEKIVAGLRPWTISVVGNSVLAAKGPSDTLGALGLANWFSDMHATGFTSKRSFGDTRFPEGSEYIGIGSYDNPGISWRDSSPLGQLHPEWDSDWTRKDNPIFSAPPGISVRTNPQYDTRGKLYSETESYTDTGRTFYEYFRKSESELDLGRRGTFESAWDHGKMQLITIPEAAKDIDQYTKHSRTYLFPKGLLGDFTSFSDIPSELDSFPPWTWNIPRGGPILSIKRAAKDVERHAKWLLTANGATWALTQVGLQILNTRPETRIWNPLSLGSVIPTIHIPRHLKLKNIGINVPKFGEKAGKAVGITYTEAEDYKGKDSRLIQFLDTYINAKGEPAALGEFNKLPLQIGGKENLFGLYRQSLGQMIYLIPGKGGIFGALPGPDVRSQQHKTADPIHKSPLEQKTPHMHLSKYKVLAYGNLKALEIDDAARGHTSQFTGESYDGTNMRREERYRLGRYGAPEQDKQHRDDGLNWVGSREDRFNAVDLINLHGYIPEGKINQIYSEGTLDGSVTGMISPETDYPDLIPFYIYDIKNKAWILLRAYLGTITDDVTSNWGSTDIAGRPVKNYYYQNTERKLSFDFKMAAATSWELAPMWQKLNYLVGLCYPSFVNDKYPTMVNPFIKLTLGDMYRHVPGFLTGLNIKPETNTPWETVKDDNKGLARVPRVVNVSANFTYVGDTMPSTTSPSHYNIADWIDANNSYWGKKDGQAIPVDILNGPADDKTKRNIDARKSPQNGGAEKKS